MVLRLGDAASELYSCLRDVLDERLRALETRIVELHLDAAKCAEDNAKYPTSGPDYLPDIIMLCTPPATQIEVGMPAPQFPQRTDAVTVGGVIDSNSAAATAA